MPVRQAGAPDARGVRVGVESGAPDARGVRVGVEWSQWAHDRKPLFQPDRASNSRSSTSSS